jgi:hypothetical protein
VVGLRTNPFSAGIQGSPRKALFGAVARAALLGNGGGIRLAAIRGKVLLVDY